MLTKVQSAANMGLDTLAIDVEISIASRGLPGFDIVGLPDKAVGESKERVRTALTNAGLDFPTRKITVNLAPADVQKEGTFYDMPIAVGILSYMADCKPPALTLFLGELSLDGSFRHTRGAILSALFAKEAGYKNLFVPAESANEAAVIGGISVYPVHTLPELLAHLCGEKHIVPVVYKEKTPPDDESSAADFDMKEVLGQEQAKRAAEIAAAGGHNMLMVGAPGSGKTMLARAIAGILPPLNERESLEVTKIYSASGNIPPGGGLVRKRQFRAPHHTASRVGLIGGGSRPQPGEVSLAHRGILFLDEFNEFPRSVLEALRQPLEDGTLVISRSRERVEYPAQFMLVASANPCPCGYLTHPKRACSCSPRMIENYQKKISGPMLDRIDLHVHVRPVDTKNLADNQGASRLLEPSQKIRTRVMAARAAQSKRFAKDNIHTNAEMKNVHIKAYCTLAPDVEQLLQQASIKFQLSARSYIKTIKVARTIADLAVSDVILASHMAEALQYQQRS